MIVIADLTANQLPQLDRSHLCTIAEADHSERESVGALQYFLNTSTGGRNAARSTSRRSEAKPR